MVRKRKGNGHTRNGRSNEPPSLIDVWGQTAGVVCFACGAPYVVSAFTDRQFRMHWQGWRICPHCGSTEATVWWAGYDDDGRTVYDADQRFLSPEELAQVEAFKPTRRGTRRLPHKRREISGSPERW